MSQTTKVLQVLQKQVPEIKKVLVELGFSFSAPPYTYFSAKGKGVVCTLYLSGKMVVQGGLAAEFLQKHFQSWCEGESVIEKKVHNLEEPHIGTDESGKGDFFGPLCIGAVYADEEGLGTLKKMKIIKDSKALSKKEICIAAQFIHDHFPSEVLIVSPSRYNEWYSRFQNLNHLLAYGHAQVIQVLAKRTGCRKILVDQFSQENLVKKMLQKQGVSQVQVVQKVRAESDLVVAAASILSRDAFVQEMEGLSNKFGIDLPKGGGGKTISIGREIVQRWGPEILQQMSKTHFKNMEKIIAL